MSIFLVVSIIIFNTLITNQNKELEQKRTRILSEISAAIEEAEILGKYRCCIEPPCIICYLGKWIWNDGGCYCTDMIRNGEFDKVCPECKKNVRNE